MNTAEITLPDMKIDTERILEKKRSSWPCNSNRASMLDDNCLRRLVYWRTCWDQAKPTDLGLQGVFETGKELEPVIERILGEIGRAAEPRWRIVARQTRVSDDLLKAHNITGTCDGIMQIWMPNERTCTCDAESVCGLHVFEDDPPEYDAAKVWHDYVSVAAVDIKTCSPHVWEQLHDYESLSRYPWTRKWRGQLMIYALGLNLERCCLICVNKTNLYQIKLIEFPLDMEYADGLIKRADDVELYVANEELPDRINQPDECSRCAFVHICNPELQSTGNMELVDNPQLEEVLAELVDLKPAKQAYDAADRKMKAFLPRGQECICGEYMVTWKQSVRNLQAQEARSVEAWAKTISKLTD